MDRMGGRGRGKGRRKERRKDEPDFAPLRSKRLDDHSAYEADFSAGRDQFVLRGGTDLPRDGEVGLAVNLSVGVKRGREEGEEGGGREERGRTANGSSSFAASDEAISSEEA